jgi:hypothetical protein
MGWLKKTSHATISLKREATPAWKDKERRMLAKIKVKNLIETVW